MIIGAPQKSQIDHCEAAERLIEAVDRKLDILGIEHDESGQPGQGVSLLRRSALSTDGLDGSTSPTWLISRSDEPLPRLIPNPLESGSILNRVGCLGEGKQNWPQEGPSKAACRLSSWMAKHLERRSRRSAVTYRRRSDTNGFRRWEKSDFVSAARRLFRERLYCIQWITKETVNERRQETFFAAPTEAESNARKGCDFVRAI